MVILQINGEVLTGGMKSILSVPDPLMVSSESGRKPVFDECAVTSRESAVNLSLYIEKETAWGSLMNARCGKTVDMGTITSNAVV